MISVARILCVFGIFLCSVAFKVSVSTPYRFPLISSVHVLSKLTHRRMAQNDIANDSDATITIDEKKNMLFGAIKYFKGDTKHEKVMEVINLLSDSNPNKNSVSDQSLMCGNFTVVAYNFLGGEFGPNGWDCTLGRLAFNLFEPNDFPVTLTHTLNTIEKIEGAEGNMSYTVIMTFISRDPQHNVKGTITLNGTCRPDKKNSERLIVTFNAGIMRPALGQKLKSWNKIFKPNEKAQLSLRKKLGNLFCRLRNMGDKGVIMRTLKSPATGHVDIMYVDKSIRITRGNAGSVIVVERT